MTPRIRPEAPGDGEAIHAVQLIAFPTSAEAQLVRMLRGAGNSEISLVAEMAGGKIVGHVMMSRMKVEGDGRDYRALGLGPVAVLPDHQRQGIGSALIHEALRLSERSGEEIVFVLGEPGYYQRFGFGTETAAPFASPYSGPYFLAKAFGVGMPTAGTAAYAPAFAEL